MNKLLMILAGVLTLGAAVPALAAPDEQYFQAIERAHKAAQARAATQPPCKARRLVLPLDDGPHATTTPYLNQLRKERFDAEVRACKDAAR